MIKVCLDQCAISELAKPSNFPGELSDLRAILLSGVDELKLICPVALETLVETTGLRSTKHRIAIHDLHCRLADARLGGPIWAFKSMWKLIKEETLALARSQPPPDAFEVIRWKSVENDELAVETWEGVVDAKQRMTERVRLAAARENKPATFRETSAGIILEHAGHVYRQINRLLLDEELEESDHMGYELAQYLRQQGATRAELKKLIQDILHHRWQAIPVIFNRTQLAARIEADARTTKNPRAYDVNDEMDIPRLAVGLSSADLIITDAAMAHLCKTIKSNLWTHAKVFAARDTHKIVTHLQTALA